MNAREVCFVLAFVGAGQACASSPVTIENLVKRAHIPIASISPDGRNAAFLVVRGDPVENAYTVDVRVSALDEGGAPLTLTTYQLAPRDAFDEFENLKETAGNIQWTSTGILLYLTRATGGAQLDAWDPERRNTKVVVSGHDLIAFANDRTNPDEVELFTTDFVDGLRSQEFEVPDRAWRLRDSNEFVGGFANPKIGRQIRQQKWALMLDASLSITPRGTSFENWESGQPEDQEADQQSVLRTPDSITYVSDYTPSPDGAMLAMVEDATLNLRQPGRTTSASRIVVSQGGRRTVVLPYQRPRRVLEILGWSNDGRSIYFVSVGPRESVVARVLLSGKTSELHREPAELRRPCALYGPLCKVMSRSGESALLIRSTNMIPSELIKVDLKSDRTIIVDSPNYEFARASQPEIRFYDIPTAEGMAYGRLYLPSGYIKGKRYPLVFTQYISRPGFYASVGDEVPIIPLTANGIAVFAMHSRELNHVSSLGNFELEISRVQRPLDGMHWIFRRLVSDGIVDPDRVGLTGVSYGAEIAMYAYWRSSIFRAVSVASLSWDPSVVSFLGIENAKSLESRGFPLSMDCQALVQWQKLVAGLNATPSLPPLLLQSSDLEENFSVPTWYRLRSINASVEWYEYPHEGHLKRSPSNKWWVYQRNLDWFRFWLQDYEDSDARKMEQYERWRDIRVQRDALLHAQQLRQ